MLEKNYFSKILFLAKSLNKKLLLIFISILILALLELIGVYLFIPLINKILNSNILITNYYIEKKILDLDKNILLFLIFFIFVFKSFLNLFFIALKNNSIKSLINVLCQKLLKNYLKKNFEFFVNFSAATLMRNLNTEIPAFANRTLLVILNLLNDIVSLFFFIAFLLYFSFQNTLIIFFCFLFLAILFLFITRKKVLFWGNERLIPEKEKIKTTQEIFYGIREIKLYKLNEFFFNKFKKYNYRILSLLAKESTLSQTPRVFFEICFIGITLYLVSFLMRAQSTDETILTLGVFAVSFSRMLPTISRIISSINSLRFSNATVNLLYKEFTNNYNDLAFNNKIENKNETKFNNLIEFKNVYFRYNSSSDFVLTDICFKINKNRIYGFFGSSGCGKSTLLDLIIGLLKPTKGSIIIDGKKIYNEFVISNSSYVSQNSFLLNESISKNITLKNSTKEEVQQILLILKKVNLYNFVKNLRNGIDTIIGEGGISISGGEKQRLILARALYQSPKILLLDEFTSALDSENEKVMLENLLILKKYVTIIIVSHSKKVLDICDKKYQLIEGRLNEIN